jgi:hypothetical protein
MTNYSMPKDWETVGLYLKVNLTGGACLVWRYDAGKLKIRNFCFSVII